ACSRHDGSAVRDARVRARDGSRDNIAAVIATPASTVYRCQRAEKAIDEVSKAAALEARKSELPRQSGREDSNLRTSCAQGRRAVHPQPRKSGFRGRQHSHLVVNLVVTPFLSTPISPPASARGTGSSPYSSSAGRCCPRTSRPRS